MATAKKHSLVLIAAVYLLGLFIGALDTGIVTPARTVIQNGMGVNDNYGIWMITIYTLAYAASIPVMGKMADKFGRKWVYLLAVALFGAGSLICGLSKDIDVFEVLLIGRAIQALGGGGIMPVATAEFGTSFPPEKRGMALGLVGGVYGIANIFGASAGSLILDLFGQANWQYIFYVNVPICIFIVVAGVVVLSNATEPDVKPIDFLGIMVLTVFTLSLLYSLRNIDFFDFANSIRSLDVYPFLILSAVLLPIFILVEKKAVDPVMNLSYFKNVNIVITLLLSIITGIVMMGMVFLPQFAENALMMRSGAGGYFIIILGLFAGFGAPMSGMFIDKFGVKAVLGFGLVASIAGSLFLALVTTVNPTIFTVVISLILIGVGMGFTMGTPLNYMMLEYTKEEEANSALATMSLVRSVGTAIAPMLMVGFITHAAATIQDDITEVLPKQVTISALPHAQDLQNKLDELAKDENTKDMMKDMDMPDLTDMETIDVDMDTSETSDYEVPDDIVQKLQDSDVTTIVDVTKELVVAMFDQISPDLIKDIDDGVVKGVDGVNDGTDELKKGMKKLQKGINELVSGIDEMDDGISQMDSAIVAQQDARAQMVDTLPMLKKMDNYSSVLDLIPESALKSIPDDVKKTLKKVKTSSDLSEQLSSLKSAMKKMKESKSGMEKGKAGIESALAQIDALEAEVADLQKQIAAETDPAKIAELSQKLGPKMGQLQGMKAGQSEMESQLAEMEKGIAGIEQGLTAQQSAYDQMAEMMPTLKQLENYKSVLDLMPESVKSALPDTVKDTLSKVKTAKDMQNQIGALDSAISQMTDARAQMVDARGEMVDAKAEMIDAKREMKKSLDEMGTMLGWMVELKEAVPGAFEEAKQNYLAKVDECADEIRAVYQTDLNMGFRGAFTLVAICSIVGLICLLFYKDKAPRNTGAKMGHGGHMHGGKNHGGHKHGGHMHGGHGSDAQADAMPADNGGAAPDTLAGDAPAGGEVADQVSVDVSEGDPIA